MTDQTEFATHDALMSAVVRIVTDGAATIARPGQAKLAHDIERTMRTPDIGEGRAHLLGEAPTGVGKTVAASVPAAIAAIQHNERTIISTESLALQRQLTTKDLPNLAEAVQQVSGVPLRFALLKGWRNYVCALKTVNVIGEQMGLDANTNWTAQHMREFADQLDIEYSGKPGEPEPDDDDDSDDSSDTDDEKKMADFGEMFPLFGTSAEPVGELEKWALAQIVQRNDGDKDSYDRLLVGNAWSEVSTDTAACLGADDCPFGAVCAPARAKDRAAMANIVVTNHAMLAVQAARNVPVVVGSKKLGVFHHLIVDEAHALPQTVRSQGATEIGAQRIIAVIRGLSQVVSRDDAAYLVMLDRAGNLGDRVEMALSNVKKDKQGVGSLEPGQNPLVNVQSDLTELLFDAQMLVANLRGIVRKGGMTPPAIELAFRRAKSGLDNLEEALDACGSDDPRLARWVETNRAGNPVLKASSVDVGGMLRTNLFMVPKDEDDENEDPYEAAEREAAQQTYRKENPNQAEQRELSVVMISATIPPQFSRQVGLNTHELRSYESPFEDAYKNSMLFIPGCDTQEDTEALSNQWGKFDTYNHSSWAYPRILELVRANNGSALVLSATTKAGQDYAEQLRRDLPGQHILSQWDGLADVVQHWRTSSGGVLVGTRSMMTGVDAPGETCTLVIVDRIPRAASNPVDEARGAALQQDFKMGEWPARDVVYGGDAALLLEQAAGRLIRSTSDSGMVAVLDPRLLKRGKFAMPKNGARPMYKRALRRFTNITTGIGDATDFLQKRSAL